ncbi:peptidase T [Lactobacillus intestinalis]|uniref:Peptidase T n=1 Tax=Lactobacillus intestinalis DSM 6629 TaxID=1423761 RepID=A0ABR5PMZ2_9LACO|nr:peptidase T [Lactobacillus intestinalis]KRM31360.1 peptidase T [Lactobacillus intestinalis DSM 6629]UTW40087.1 peptidase T [Lactobacillus intestinalis]
MVDYDFDYIKNKFIQYAKMNTRSDENSNAIPTTKGQVKLLKELVSELKKLGLVEVSYSEKDAYTVGKIAANIKEELAPIGFVAHVDTADFNADNIQPQIFENYDGQDIVLGHGYTLSATEFPSLKKVIGQTLITASGNTLLGADDKAGIAGLLGMAKYLKDNPEIKHGDIWLAFGPDEEIGQGAKRFDVSRFPVEFSYTLDNGNPGDIAYETFNAAAAKIKIKGTVVHPGEAYHLMVNATLIANEFINQLPTNFVPEESRDYQGFILILRNDGNVDHAEIDLIIRDFDTDSFLKHKKLIENTVKSLNQKYGEGRVSLKMYDQYISPGDTIKKHPYVVNLVHHAYQKMNLPINHVPFRGGTDGNFITQKGIPTPNLFNGGANFHGRYEYVTVENMLLLAKTLTAIVTEHVKLDNKRDETPLTR